MNPDLYDDGGAVLIPIESLIDEAFNKSAEVVHQDMWGVPGVDAEDQIQREVSVIDGVGGRALIEKHAYGVESPLNKN